MSGGSEEAFNQKYGDAIKAKFPDYAIKFIRSEPGETLPDLLAAKQRIDFVFNVFDYALDPLFSYNLQYDMTELVKKHQVDLTQIEPTLMDAVKNAGNGKLYLLPTDQQIQVMYYNKGIFDKFGVPYPRNGMTWDETLELSKKLTRKDGEKQYLGFAASPAFIFKTNPYSEPYLDPKTEKSTFERDTWKKLIQTVFVSPSQDQG
ncbi:carbohydrate ABC transporter substrate-binding protein [Paenibacillus mesophilus]|uniref:ABC transporter substrate-binding protein n=1 Tax=Paenibacillus mesophilus TaxID=2582849 RepID=UPI00110E3CCA|nr:ABC transporter substrate-binding protein [Paenibacillus mesophilus]TMV45176.1 carbohydrate ABC transporter substrate-binding protein [Paenibacillus mesophilus]